jgi:hypothetical protein
MERSEVIKAVNSGDAIMAFQAGLSEGINLAVDHLVRFANLSNCKTLAQVTSKVMDMQKELEHV